MQVEGAVHGVVVHVQRVRVILFVKEGGALLVRKSSPEASVLGAAKCVLKLKFNRLFSTSLIFQMKVGISCYCHQEKQASVLL